MIKVINAEGIIPEILTLSSRISENDIKSNYYSRNLQFKINEISKDFKMPFEWNILYFNHVVNRYLDKYDLIINNNNTSFLLNKSLNILSYVHFPRKARNLDTKKSIHFPSGPDKSIWDYKSDLFGIAAKLYRKDKLIKNDLIVANSEFTKSKILDFYNIPSKNIEVVYPPVETEGILNKKQKNQVVSLGRFAPDKRQLEQIMIAQKLQKYHFYIIGFVNSKDYYEFCKDYIISNNLNNITLVADATKKEMLEILSTSSYFIHSIRNEPFGITTVQAIHNSVIPIVHNSGGQKEIVSCNELRYDDKKDAVKVFNYLSQISDYKRESYIRTLKENVKAFSIDNYERKLKKLINKKIDALA